MSTIEQQIHTLKNDIILIKQNNNLSSVPLVLLGASKGQSAEIIEKSIHCRLSTFGENRVQEAWEKWPELKKRYPHIQLHLIGPLQTNKIKDALALFDVIQTLDRPRLAEEISSLISPSKKRPAGDWQPATKNFFIQINTGCEPQKSGVFPKDADAFIRYCRDDLQLPVTGLMCIPPADQPPAPHFALLRKIAQRNNLPELSMGMSEDYQAAIRMGSTCIRLGRALFGERKKPT